MIKNAIIYRISGLPVVAVALGEALASNQYHPASASQTESTGWAPPRGEAHGALVEAVDGHWIARFVIETRTVPADAVVKRADEMAAAIERDTGRTPGKMETRDLRAAARDELLPHAFSRVKSVRVWLDHDRGRLVLDTTSQATADTVITSLVRALPQGFHVALLQTTIAPQARMAAWLADEDGHEVPRAFSLGTSADLCGVGAAAARVRYAHHNLDTMEVREHIAQGKLPTSLELSYADRVAFTLTNQLQLRRITLLDVATAGANPNAVDQFDADVALITGELQLLIDALVRELDGDYTSLPEDANAEVAS